MDQRTKRLLKVLVFSLIVIALAKMGLTRTYDALSKAAEKKQAASARAPSPQPAPAAAEIIDTPAASAVGETATADTAASAADQAR